jgi:hypothetical protein
MKNRTFNKIKKNKVGFILKRTNNVMIEKQVIKIINTIKQKRKTVFIIFSNHPKEYENDFKYTLNIIKKTKLKRYETINEKDYRKLFIKMSQFKKIFSMLFWEFFCYIAWKFKRLKLYFWFSFLDYSILRILFYKFLSIPF